MYRLDQPHHEKISLALCETGIALFRPHPQTPQRQVQTEAHLYLLPDLTECRQPIPLPSGVSQLTHVTDNRLCPVCFTDPPQRDWDYSRAESLELINTTIRNAVHR